MTSAFDEIRKHIKRCDEVSEPFGSGAQCLQALPMLEALEAQTTGPKRLQWLVANAHQVSIDCNQHRCYYDSIETALEEDFCRDMSDEERAECVAKNTLCVLQMYPETPVGFVVWAHSDPEVCVERAYQWLRKERGVPIEDPGPHPKDSE